MEWSPEATYTVGGVFFGVIALLYRFISQRSDPKLIDVLGTLAAANTKATDANAKSDERIGGALDLLTEALNRDSDEMAIMKTGNEQVYASILKLIDTSESNQQRRQGEMLGAWESFRSSVRGEHVQHAEALSEALKIMPEIERLSEQQAKSEEQSKGLVEVMGEGLKSQVKTNGDIISLLREIKSELKSIRESSAEQYGETLKRLDKTDQTVARLEDNLTIEQTKKEKTNEQLIEQHNGLADPGGTSGRIDQHDSGNAGETVPPLAAGTDTQRNDDQGQPAIS